MSVDRSYRDHINLSKRIPLHYQKRYLANISNGSFNATLKTGVYKNKIKTLLKNNRVLAIALQNDKAKKEELLEENKANANIIMFSRLKIASLSDNLKKVVTVLDETLALLQMHSSVSSFKFTPRNTLGREEFKEQVKEVSMDSIPEESESPHRKENETNIEKVTCLNKKQSEMVNKEVSPRFQVAMSNKKSQPLEDPKNCRKSLKLSSSNEKSSIPNTNEIDKDTINNGYCASTASVYSYDESSPAKTVATQSKNKLSSKNKNISPEAGHKKVAPKPVTKKKKDKATKNAVRVGSKTVGCFAEGKNNKQTSSPLKNNFYQSKLPNDIQILDVQTAGNNSNTRNGNLNATGMQKNGVSPSKLHGNIENNTYVISDYEKENESCNTRQKLSGKKFKRLSEVELEPKVTKRTYSRSSALKCLSPNVNIEKVRSRGNKGKTSSRIDDLITTNQKSTGFTLLCPESRDTSRSYLQELSLHQQEMVRNLAENTYLVTAEVHKSLESIKTDKIKSPKTECSFSKQPVVLVKDIFQSGKSFCKSISGPACDGLNGIPLELQLLGHYSSLKVIPEESSIRSQDSSDQTDEKASKTRLKNIEPPLSVEDELLEQPLHEEKRVFRKRSASINYKERPANIKLRR